jgi:Eco57I restriction-modification methylase
VTATPALTTELQQQVLLLEDDLRARLQADSEREGQWKQEHQRALDKERSAASWVAWRDDRVTQAAAAWVLTSVFVRFCEDNRLVGPVWIAGPENRRQEALDAQLAYFRDHPEDTDREWLQAAIDYLGGLPATRGLVEAHSALHLIAPSGNSVTRLLDFWRDRREDGALAHDLSDASLSTRFLGDLYQDLSQHAKETYALLQTPVFVEEFILDQTLEPALKERPLDGFKLIDPTCGSGHFLLGAFDRLLDRWGRQAPGLEIQARVQQALDAIHGVDLNPFAVAIARFRLTVAALKAVGLTSLEGAPAFAFHLAVGDSLIHGSDPDVLPGMGDRSAFMSFTYATEDGPLLLTLLEESRYDVVVGNPPYITVKDKAINQIYRSKFSDVCKGTYALTVPFMAEFFALAIKGEQAGWVGQITSNSFMKREFGTKLIEDFLVKKDLRLVADTSGAYIPGHGTPTVIIVGRNQAPVDSTVRAVLGVRGEPGRPEDPAKGIIWTSIVEHVGDQGWDDEWITIADLHRSVLAAHPWSLSGGGAAELMESIESSKWRTIADAIAGKIGFASFPGADDAFLAPRHELLRDGVPHELVHAVITGDVVRDWRVHEGDWALAPYDAQAKLVPLDVGGWGRRQWPFRVVLGGVTGFGGETRAAAGDPWWGWYRWVAQRYRTPLTITFAFVATHNHFVLDRGDRVFKQTAPVIKLPEDSTEDDHLALLGVLNSSTACFWLKQKSHNKGEGGGARVDAGYATRGEPFRETYEFSSTTLQDFPIPHFLPLQRGRLLDSLGRDLSKREPAAVANVEMPSSATFAKAQQASKHIHSQMVAIQDELDWETYKLYGLIDQDLTYGGNDLPGITAGERAFEILLARAVLSGDEETTWFAHPEQLSTAITNIPAHWPTEYQELVQRRLEVIASNPSIRLMERPEYKRRWASEPWEKRQERAVREWLLDRLEDRRFWFDAQRRPLPRSVAQLADDVNRDKSIISVLALWEGRPDVPVTQSLVRLLANETVPFLGAYRYKDSGLRKREAWEQTWALQRREDNGEKVGTVAVPPRYTSADFRKNSYWQARGKLDVPKERFILYPDAGRETDPTALLGWAGWDHAEQALALSVIIGEREKDGWEDERFIPLVAGLAELQPWVEQWHGEVDPNYGVSLAAFCREQLASRAAQVGKTLQELAQWRPAPARRGRRARSSE